MARRQRKNSNVIELTDALLLNGKAIEEGPAKKRWTEHDLRHIKPLTPTQEDFFQDFLQGKNICAYGSAGTGKSFVAIYLALNEIVNKSSGIKKIIIVRSAVPTRDLGFMPGDYEEKCALYELPYKEMFGFFMGRKTTYDDMKAAGIVEFCTTSYLRGLTWDNTIVIVDEAQNLTFHEFNSVMTRLGENSKVIVVGDSKQTDLNKKNEKSGLNEFIEVCKRIESFSIIKFNSIDVVRSKFVRSWIMACEDIEK